MTDEAREIAWKLFTLVLSDESGSTWDAKQAEQIIDSALQSARREAFAEAAGVAEDLQARHEIGFELSRKPTPSEIATALRARAGEG